MLVVGQKIQVQITKIDDRGKLSLAPVEADEAAAEPVESIVEFSENEPQNDN